MDILAPFVERLLNEGKVLTAIVFVLLVLVVAGVSYRLLTRNGKSDETTAQSDRGGQTTQVKDVRSKEDVNVSPTQRNG